MVFASKLVNEDGSYVTKTKRGVHALESTFIEAIFQPKSGPYYCAEQNEILLNKVLSVKRVTASITSELADLHQTESYLKQK